MTETIDIFFLIFAVPFAILGLSCILNTDIPDREADIQAGKHNFIVRFDRPRSFFFITCLYFLAVCLFVVFALTDVLKISINLWIPAFFLLIPFIVSLQPVLKKIQTKETATVYAMRNVNAGFCAIIFISIYFVLMILI